MPGLAVIMVGERQDSAKYVSMKQVSKSRPTRWKQPRCYPWYASLLMCLLSSVLIPGCNVACSTASCAAMVELLYILVREASLSINLLQQTLLRSRLPSRPTWDPHVPFPPELVPMQGRHLTFPCSGVPVGWGDLHGRFIMILWSGFIPVEARAALLENTTVSIFEISTLLQYSSSRTVQCSTDVQLVTKELCDWPSIYPWKSTSNRKQKANAKGLRDYNFK